MATDAEREVARLEQQLEQAMNRVPDRVRAGGALASAQWLEARAAAQRLLKKRSGTSAAQLRSALNRLV